MQMVHEIELQKIWRLGARIQLSSSEEGGGEGEGEGGGEGWRLKVKKASVTNSPFTNREIEKVDWLFTGSVCGEEEGGGGEMNLRRKLP